MNLEESKEEAEIWGFASVRELAAFRLLIKGELRKKGIEYNADDPLTLLVRGIYTQVIEVEG